MGLDSSENGSEETGPLPIFNNDVRSAARSLSSGGGLEQQSDINGHTLRQYSALSRVSPRSPLLTDRELYLAPARIARFNRCNVNPALETLVLSLATHGELQGAARILFLGAEPHPDLPDTTIGWQPFKPKADAWDAAGRPRIDLPTTERFPLILILPGKSRDETLGFFAIAHAHLEADGHLLVAMPNTAGASRFENELEQAVGQITSIQKHKCRAFHARNHGSWNASLFAKWQQFNQGQTITGTHYQTVAGIFSSEHIDPGSQLRADHLPKHLSGIAADLGAGWGFLSDRLLIQCPNISHLDLYEADTRALGCARHNLSPHTPIPIAYHWHDLRHAIDGSYDVIVMNPPFHTGQATDLDLGRAFVHTAAKALRRGGQLFVVANRQLPYESELDTAKLRWRKPIETPTFKLLFASK